MDPVVFPRRAHLKECFDTLKKNIPNVDEKKTSNLSVLRSALRYIQVRTLTDRTNLSVLRSALRYIQVRTLTDRTKK